MTVMRRGRPGLELRSIGCRRRRGPGSKSHAAAAHRRTPAAASSSARSTSVLLLKRTPRCHFLPSSGLSLSSNDYDSSAYNFILSSRRQVDATRRSAPGRGQARASGVRLGSSPPASREAFPPHAPLSEEQRGSVFLEKRAARMKPSETASRSQDGPLRGGERGGLGAGGVGGGAS